MAVAAEALKQQTREFDWYLAKAQFSEDLYNERPPESEIYGRSLSTPYLLGVAAMKLASAEVVHSPEADQARVEFFTSVEEGFGTDRKHGRGLKVRDFDTRPVMGGKVMSKDLKRAVSDMTFAGLINAQETVKKDPRFKPQLVRSGWDHNNALIVDKMVSGETGYNTRMVATPCPVEAIAESGNKFWDGIGYVSHLKRGFFQVYHVTEKGELLSGSLSFDGGSKEKLREIFARHGVEIPEDEITDNWLQYALTGNFTTEEAKELGLKIADEATSAEYKKTTNTVDVTGEHRVIMNTVFDESYIHACESLAQGHQTEGTQSLILQLASKADDFNDRYADALYSMKADASRFADDDMVVLHELLVYSAIEMMRALHLQKTQPAGSTSDVYSQDIRVDAQYLQSLSVDNFQRMLGGFGADGARNNRTYSACGLAISPGDNDPLSKLMGINNQDVFGGVDAKQEWYGKHKKQGTCVNCKEDTEVGERSWCKSCIKGHCGTK